jgi:hypothetical protein
MNQLENFGDKITTCSVHCNQTLKIIYIIIFIQESLKQPVIRGVTRHFGFVKHISETGSVSVFR